MVQRTGLTIVEKRKVFPLVDVIGSADSVRLIAPAGTSAAEKLVIVTWVFTTVSAVAAQLPKEDLYYELARQTRGHLAVTQHSRTHMTEQFKAVIYRGFEDNGYSAEQVTVGMP